MVSGSTAADGFKQAYKSFCESGWNGRPARAEFGGQGMPTLLSTAALEMWKASNMAFSLCQMLTLGAVEAIAHHGSHELKRMYLPAMVEGRWTATMNLTEPQAGSDLSAIRSKAVPEGDHWRVSGTKIFMRRRALAPPAAPRPANNAATPASAAGAWTAPPTSCAQPTAAHTCSVPPSRRCCARSSSGPTRSSRANN